MEQLAKSIDSVSLNDKAKVGVFFHKDMLLHKSSKNHVENPDRLSAILDHLEKEKLFSECKIYDQFDTISKEVLVDFHGENYVDYVESLWEEGYQKDTRFYKDTYYNKDTSRAAGLAANAVKLAVDEVLAGSIDRAFAIVRPPGHHAAAQQNKIGGFCIYNNVAIAAKYAIKQYGLKRVVIFDWDVHHGDGTSHFLYKDASVLYISIHRYDEGTFYPGKSGDISKLGEGKGKGYNLNYPWNLPSDDDTVGDNEYVYALDRIFVPIIRQFNPEMIFISAGFDAACEDPLGGLDLSPDGYAYMTKKLMDLAPSRLIIGLEGGYNLQSISQASEACLRILLGQEMPLKCSENNLSIVEMERLCCPNRIGLKTADSALKNYVKYWPIISSDPKAVELEKVVKENLVLYEKSRQKQEFAIEQKKFIRHPPNNFGKLFELFIKEQDSKEYSLAIPLFPKYIGTTRIDGTKHSIVENIEYFHSKASTLLLKIGHYNSQTELADKLSLYISEFRFKNHDGEVLEESFDPKMNFSTEEVSVLIRKFLYNDKTSLESEEVSTYFKTFFNNLKEFLERNNSVAWENISVMLIHESYSKNYNAFITRFNESSQVCNHVDDIMNGINHLMNILNGL